MALLALLAAAGLLALWLAAGAGRQSPRRRWARVAQRRAPVAGPAGRRSAAWDVLDHVDAQLKLLLSERHRLGLLLQRGQQLRTKLARAGTYADRLADLDEQLDQLWDKARHLDGLAARYQRHCDELALLAETADFDEMVRRYEAESVVGSQFGGLSAQTDELDDEAERLLAVVEAERELDVMLRS